MISKLSLFHYHHYHYHHHHYYPHHHHHLNHHHHHYHHHHHRQSHNRLIQLNLFGQLPPPHSPPLLSSPHFTPQLPSHPFLHSRLPPITYTPYLPLYSSFLFPFPLLSILTPLSPSPPFAFPLTFPPFPFLIFPYQPSPLYLTKTSPPSPFPFPTIPPLVSLPSHTPLSLLPLVSPPWIRQSGHYHLAAPFPLPAPLTPTHLNTPG